MNPIDPLHVHLEPTWMGRERIRHSQIPERVCPWLWDRASLTARLKAACRHGGFRVRVVRQGWGKPLYSEARLLDVRRGSTAIVREVQLLCGGMPWVFARTLIPATSLCGPARRLAHLGDRPLGEVLFSDLRMRRGDTQVARLLPRHPLFVSATQGLEPRPPEIWGRRTLFYLSSKPLLVNEIFLPGLPESPR